MDSLGISVFFGLGQSNQQNIEYLHLAESLGYKKLFTSLHIPEADYHEFETDCRFVLSEARRLGFEVTADIAPQVWDGFDFGPKGVKEWGIQVLRSDYGFSPAQLKELVKKAGVMLEVNASTMTEAELYNLLWAGLDCKILRAGHNYYPHPHTGLSFEFFGLKSGVFRSLNIPVSAFIPGKTHPRGPIFEGLPTVESHRWMAVDESASQMWYSGMVNTLFFGDPLVSRADLAAAASVFVFPVPDTLELRVGLMDVTEEERQIIRASVHVSRRDASEQVVRSRESRRICFQSIPSRPLKRNRRRGDVTIDNSLFGRYAGELQIVLRELPPDERVNVVGRVIDKDLHLLNCLFPERSFCFKEVEKCEY